MSNKYNVGQTVYAVESVNVTAYALNHKKTKSEVYERYIQICKTKIMIEEVEIDKSGIITYNNKYSESFVFANEKEAEEFIKNVKIER